MVEIRDGKKVLITPVSAEDLADINIGDIIYLDGDLMTCRDVALGIDLVEGLHAVVAQRRFKGGLDDSFLEQGLHLVDEREARAALDPELEHAGVLAAGAVKGDGQPLVARHGIIERLGQRAGFLLRQLIQLGNHVVGQLLADVAHEAGHDVGHFGDHFLLRHAFSSLWYGQNCPG